MTTRTRTISIVAAAAALGGATVASTSPAQAWCGHHGCGYGYSDGALAAGIIGGLAVGAIAASAAHQAQQARDEEARRAHYANRRQAARKARPVRQAAQ